MDCNILTSRGTIAPYPPTPRNKRLTDCENFNLGGRTWAPVAALDLKSITIIERSLTLQILSFGQSMRWKVFTKYNIVKRINELRQTIQSHNKL